MSASGGAERAVRRLTDIEPTVLDGAPWWPLRAVCDALRTVDYNGAARLIDAGHKRRVITQPKDWRMRKCCCLIDRRGVERLVIRYCREIPRAAVMAALDARAKQRAAQE